MREMSWALRMQSTRKQRRTHQRLWSKTNFIRKLLEEFGIKTGKKEIPFTNWESLANCALLSIKWHLEHHKPHWHWVVFVRESEKSYVLDSKKTLKTNIRIDFG